MTNYERIKRMSIEEMAEEISSGGNCDYCVAKDRCDNLALDIIATVPCAVLTREWLEQEVEE